MSFERLFVCKAVHDEASDIIDMWRITDEFGDLHHHTSNQIIRFKSIAPGQQRFQ